jgi:hypothetical protein
MVGSSVADRLNTAPATAGDSLILRLECPQSIREV